MKHIKIIILTLLLGAALSCHADPKLTGTVIGTEISVDYTTSQSSTTANTREMAFDGDFNTTFASYERSYTWCGLDLGEPHIITRVGWAARNDNLGPRRMILGLFEGANLPDFSDAIPLYLITEAGTIGSLKYAEVDVSKGVRYVRYVGPNDARCNVAELEFYGHKGMGDNSHFHQLTNIPTISIKTQNAQEPYDKEHQITSTITIISDNGTKILQDKATTRLRGNASMDFPKKPYRIKFEHQQQILDAPATAKKWTLINNYGDKTLMRNTLAFQLSKWLQMPYTPYCKAVDLILNGEYKGCYQLCDQIQAHKGRVEIQQLHTTSTDINGGYLIEIDAYANAEKSMFYSDYGTPVTIKSPEEDSITSQQYNYISAYYSKAEQQWRKYLDFNTFLRHFIVGELSGNTDTYWSVFMYKQLNNDTLYTGPVWDFDLAFDNDQRTYPVNNKNDFIYRSGGSTVGYMRQLVDQIVIHDNNARQQLELIWQQTRDNGLNTDTLIAFINNEENNLQQSATLNFIRWPILSTQVHQNPAARGSYTKEVQVIKDYINKRIAWMDKKLHYTPNTSTNQPTFQIDFSTPYNIYTTTGQLIRSSATGPTTQQNLTKGIYITQQQNIVNKIIIQ